MGTQDAGTPASYYGFSERRINACLVLQRAVLAGLCVDIRDARRLAEQLVNIIPDFRQFLQLVVVIIGPGIAVWGACCRDP